ncbi:MAG: hypothetical protein IJP90_03530 [Treponema sp.]|nr:hypothetical protein [Treponema sp.]
MQNLKFILQKVMEAVSDETIPEIGRELGVDCVIISDFAETAEAVVNYKVTK